jgi:hypothetical protein
MPGYERITRCLELTDEDLEKAVVSSAATKELIAHLVSIARPNDGAPKIILLFARMAAGSCDWLDGYLHLEITGDEQTSGIEVMTELGGGMRERVLPRITLGVPLSEFARALERAPHLVEPLVVQEVTAARVVLTALPEPPASARAQVETRPTAPPPFDLDEYARKRTGPAPNMGEIPTMRPPTLPGVGVPAKLGDAILLTEDKLVARIGPLDRVPRLIASPDQRKKLSMDRSVAFLLSQVDGILTLEMLLDVSGMPRIDALRILYALLEQQAISAA